MAGPVLFILIFISGEYQRLITYFQEEGYSTGGPAIGFFASMIFSCSLVIALNCGFFMSNEKNSSLFTVLLANTKDLFTCILARFVLEGNKYTVNIVLGLTISTIGAVMFSTKSIFDNMKTGFSKNKIESSENEINEINDSTAQEVEIKTENGNNSP